MLFKQFAQGNLLIVQSVVQGSFVDGWFGDVFGLTAGGLAGGFTGVGGGEIVGVLFGSVVGTGIVGSDALKQTSLQR
jgi:hypothetical protein